MDIVIHPHTVFDYNFFKKLCQGCAEKYLYIFPGRFRHLPSANHLLSSFDRNPRGLLSQIRGVQPFIIGISIPGTPVVGLQLTSYVDIIFFFHCGNVLPYQSVFSDRDQRNTVYFPRIGLFNNSPVIWIGRILRMHRINRSCFFCPAFSIPVNG